MGPSRGHCLSGCRRVGYADRLEGPRPKRRSSTGLGNRGGKMGLAAAKKARMNVSPLDGDDTAAEVAKSFSFYERYRTNLKNPNS